MKLEIPFVYRAKIEFPPRRRDDLSWLHCQDCHLGTTEIEIPEVGGEEAPLVLTARNLDGQPLSIRYRNGRFFRQPHFFAAPADLTRGTRGSHWRHHPIITGYEADGLLTSLTMKAVEMWFGGGRLAVPDGDVVWELRERGLAEAMASIKRMILIDGEVWTASAEPTLLVETMPDGMGRSNGSTVKLKLDGHMGRRDFGDGVGMPISVKSPIETQLFNVNDLNDAIAHGFEASPGGAVFAFDGLEVVDPGRFVFDRADSHLARTASEFLELTCGNLSHGREDEIGAWLSLRKALSAVQDGRLNPVGLVDRIEAAIALCGDDLVRRRIAASMEFYDDLTVELRLGLRTPSPSAPR